MNARGWWKWALLWLVGGLLFAWLAVPASGNVPSSPSAPVATPAPVQVCFQDGTAGYAGTRDTYLDRSSPTTPFGSLDTLRASGDAGQVMLLSFDLSAIPSNAQVQSAYLRLYAVERSAVAGISLSAHQVYRAWQEEQATWNSASAGTTWGAPGCNSTITDRGATAVSSAQVNAVNTWVQWDITPLVQLWINDPARNYGLVLRGAGDSSVRYGFRSSESTNITQRPQLCLTYVVPANQWGQIVGKVWHDRNGDGILQVGEPALAGARLELWRGQQKLSEYTTTSSGAYAFSTLVPDTYTVIEVNPPGYRSTTPDSRTVAVAAGETVRVDFGDQLVSPPKTSLLPLLGSRFGAVTPTPAPTPYWRPGTGLSDKQVNALLRFSDACDRAYAGVDELGLFRTLNGGQSWERRGLDYSVLEMVLVPWNNAYLFAATWGAGVMHSADGGASWIAMNAGLEGHHWLYAIAMDPWRNTLYAGTADSGVYKSTNGGTSWSPVNNGLTDLAIRALAIDPAAGQSVVYAGTLAHGVFKSTDGGASWQNIGPANVRVRDIEIDPLNPSIIFVATDDGVYRSSDGGGSWPPAYHKLAGTRVNALALLRTGTDASSPLVIYAGREEYGVYVSRDGGASWEAMNTGLPAGTSVRSLIVGGAGAGCPRLYAGTRAGGVWVWR
jgi:hypothetical protein